MIWFVGLIADTAAFILVPWIVWRLLGRNVPFAVLPIMMGLGLAMYGGAPTQLGIPSAPGTQLGWVGVLLLAFTAGLETRTMAATAAHVDCTRYSPGLFAAIAW